MRPKPEVIELLRKAVNAATGGYHEAAQALNELCRLHDEAEVSSLEERQAWDRYAADDSQGSDPIRLAQKADKLLVERRKRFGSAK